MISNWPAPAAEGSAQEELLVSFDQQRERRLLVIPALFDEANKMRRFTVQVMRELDRIGIDSFLPDLPGQNESLQDLSDQTLTKWQEAALQAARHVGATEVLTIRAGAVLAPENLPGTLYAPHESCKQLRSMLRARVIAAGEAGIEEKSETLTELGSSQGLELAGWSISAEMFRELQESRISPGGSHGVLDQKAVGGRGLWLRAEPDEDQEQAEQLASIIADPQAAFA